MEDVSQTQTNVSKKRRFITRRKVIDAMAVITFFVVLLPVVFSDISTIGYQGYDTIPDDVHELDLSIESFADTIPADFQDKYQNPERLGDYDFVYLSDSKKELSVSENYNKSAQSIVYITTYDVSGSYLGAGTILTNDGLILTNHHVIEGATKVVVSDYEGRLFPVDKVIAYNKDLDIAFLKIDATDLRAMPLGDSDLVVVGEETLVIGHSEQLLYSLSSGIVSGIRDFSSQGAGVEFQITNPISGGNSGGAMLNKYGEMLGVPSWAIEYENNSVQVQNLNFAMPINTTLSLLQ